MTRLHGSLAHVHLFVGGFIVREADLPNANESIPGHHLHRGAILPRNLSVFRHCTVDHNRLQLGHVVNFLNKFLDLAIVFHDSHRRSAVDCLESNLVHCVCRVDAHRLSTTIHSTHRRDHPLRSIEPENRHRPEFLHPELDEPSCGILSIQLVLCVCPFLPLGPGLGDSSAHFVLLRARSHITLSGQSNIIRNTGCRNIKQLHHRARGC
mmetsp:Transcript_91477/g.244963  ORF Transcript_91477/g.244963 Transcript_91477/m.244963 type:complete len:209 (-) Transcript_91477:1353-1979(-)